MNISKKKSNISKIRFENQVVDKPHDIANIFNTYFSTIGEKLARNIPHTEKHFFLFLGKPIPNSIFFAPSMHQVRDNRYSHCYEEQTKRGS